MTSSFRRKLHAAAWILGFAAPLAGAQGVQVEPYFGAQVAAAPQVEWTEPAPYSGGFLSSWRVEYRMAHVPVIGGRVTYWISTLKGLEAVAAHSRGLREVRAGERSEVLEKHGAHQTLVGMRLTTLLLGVGDFRLTGAGGVMHISFGGPAYREERPFAQAPVLASNRAFGTTFALSAEYPLMPGTTARVSLHTATYRMRYEEGAPPGGEMERGRQYDNALSAGIVLPLQRR